MGLPGLSTYIAARLGFTPSPFMAIDQLPPASAMRIAPGPRPYRKSASGTANTYGQIWDNDPNTDIKGALWYGSNGSAGIAQRMLRDPHVRQTVRYIADPLGSCSWRFETKGTRPVDKEAAQFCNWAFLEQPWWPRYRERAITNYASCGFDLHEMTDDMRPLPPGRFPLHLGGVGGLIPIGMHEIQPCTVSYFYPSKSDPNQLDHVSQWQPFSDVEGCGWRDIPADRIVRLTWAQEGANFAGMSPLRSAYGPWKLKTAFQTILAILHDRCGVPYPSIVLPPDCSPEDKDQAELILAEMRSNPRGYMTLPNGAAFKWEQAGADDAENLRNAIILCDNDIAQNVSAGFMMLSLNDKTGSNALASTQQGQYHLSTATHAAFVASGLNSAPDGWSPVERIVRANYGPDVIVPKLCARNLPTHPWQETAKVAINAITARAIRKDAATEERIREWIQLDPFDPESEIVDAKPLATPFVGKPANLDPVKQGEPEELEEDDEDYLPADGTDESNE
jgi:hypothetical protein